MATGADPLGISSIDAAAFYFSGQTFLRSIGDRGRESKRGESQVSEMRWENIQQQIQMPFDNQQLAVSGIARSMHGWRRGPSGVNCAVLLARPVSSLGIRGHCSKGNFEIGSHQLCRLNTGK